MTSQINDPNTIELSNHKDNDDDRKYVQDDITMLRKAILNVFVGV